MLCLCQKAMKQMPKMGDLQMSLSEIIQTSVDWLFSKLHQTQSMSVAVPEASVKAAVVEGVTLFDD